MTITLTASLQVVKKKSTTGEPYIAERWAWRMRAFPEGSTVRLVGLGPDRSPEEVFEIPANECGGRRFIYCNRTHRENRVGSWLDRWRVSEDSSCGR